MKRRPDDLGVALEIASATNAWSIFISFNGVRTSESRLEWPVPKSSTARFTPRIRRRVRISMAHGVSGKPLVSVISTISAPGGTPCFRSFCSIRSAMPGSSSSNGETLTATQQSGRL